MAIPNNAWGRWDDDGPYFVPAVCSLEEAAKYLDDLMVSMGGDECEAVPVRQNAIVKYVWDCDFEGSKPCTLPGCRHGHAETVFEFRLEEKVPIWCEGCEDEITEKPYFDEHGVAICKECLKLLADREKE